RAARGLPQPPRRPPRAHPLDRHAARRRQARRRHQRLQGTVRAHRSGRRRRRRRGEGGELVVASGQERVLRRRIKSVQSTKKITRGMELTAASRIVKAQQRVAAARPYSEQITEVIRNVASTGAGRDHPLLAQRDPVRTVAYIVVSADRGLAGAYNATVIRT